MTFTAFTLYVIDYDQAHHKERSGQAAFNALWNVRPDLADQVRGTDLDPFHNDAVLLPFWHFVQEAW